MRRRLRRRKRGSQSTVPLFSFIDVIGGMIGASNCNIARPSWDIYDVDCKKQGKYVVSIHLIYST